MSEEQQPAPTVTSDNINLAEVAVDLRLPASAVNVILKYLSAGPIYEAGPVFDLVRQAGEKALNEHRALLAEAFAAESNSDGIAPSEPQDQVEVPADIATEIEVSSASDGEGAPAAADELDPPPVAAPAGGAE